MTAEESRNSLSSSIRDAYQLFKIRELNDTHHAFDAFLACTMGTFMDKHLSWISDESVAVSKARQCWLASKEKVVNGQLIRPNTNGIVLGYFNKDQIDQDTGEVLRDAGKHIAYLNAVWGYRDHFIVYRKDTNTGEFFDATKYPAMHSNSHYPIRNNLPIERYGGYNSIKPAYVAAIAYTKGKKKSCKLVNVPIMLVKEYEKNPSVLIDYLIRYEGFSSQSNIQILRNKLPRNQAIIYNGSQLLLRSCKEVWNGKQLYLDRATSLTLYRLLHDELSDAVTQNDYELLINNLLDKLCKQFPIYDSVAEKLEAKKKIILKFDRAERKTFITRFLTMIQVGAAYPLFKRYMPELGLSDRDGRLQLTIQTEKITLIDQSITGFYERRTPLWVSGQ